MYYAYNKNRRNEIIPFTLRDEAVDYIRGYPVVIREEEEKSVIDTKRIWKDIYAKVETITNKKRFHEYYNSYEAVLLYIIRLGQEVYPEYVTRKKIGQIFTVTMLRWFLVMRRPFTKEKPIRATYVKKYHAIGFRAFDKYYENVKRWVQHRKNDEGWLICFTEISQEDIRRLLDDKVLQTIEKAVEDCRYPANTERITRNLYSKLPRQYKNHEGRK